mmetsp:Transcript_106618/g.318682  ORF Transcript_106618/g.318682 Transcript_106618/m.318682 type:complete len:275 (+) Transcript_106618:97-921(+)
MTAGPEASRDEVLRGEASRSTAAAAAHAEPAPHAGNCLAPAGPPTVPLDWAPREGSGLQRSAGHVGGAQPAAEVARAEPVQASWQAPRSRRTARRVSLQEGSGLQRGVGHPRGAQPAAESTVPPGGIAPEARRPREAAAVAGGDLGLGLEPPSDEEPHGWALQGARDVAPAPAPPALARRTRDLDVLAAHRDEEDRPSVPAQTQLPSRRRPVPGGHGVPVGLHVELARISEHPRLDRESRRREERVTQIRSLLVLRDLDRRAIGGEVDAGGPVR